MDKKVLVTGFWMGPKAESEDDCTICNYDCSWLFENPSTLIWSDKILITPHIMETIELELYPEKESVLAKIIRKTFELARDYNLIEVKDSSGVLTDEMLEALGGEVERDRAILARLYPNHVRLGDQKKVPGQIFLDGEEYCTPRIGGIYSSLILAREWDARCLFSPDSLHYCKFKFGTSLIDDHCIGYPPNAFDTIFDSFLPEHKLFPKYVLQHFDANLCKACKTCEHEAKCNREYLKEFEGNLSKYLELRDYDEINQIKALISDIILRLKLDEERVDHDSIVREFREEERKITKRIRSTFPKIDRWSNLALIASIPVAVVGIATELPALTATAASVAGLSKITEGYVKHLKSKYKWIGFINRFISNRRVAQSSAKQKD